MVPIKILEPLFQTETRSVGECDRLRSQGDDLNPRYSYLQIVGPISLTSNCLCQTEARTNCLRQMD
jgi:hypothetical protein